MNKPNEPNKSLAAQKRELDKTLDSRRAFYYEQKRKLTEQIERRNSDSLYFLMTHDGWGYKLFGRSVLIYYYYAAKRAEITARIQKDKDIQNSQKSGVILIKNLEPIIEKLKKAGIFVKQEKVLEDVTRVRLKKRFSKEEIEGMRDSQEFQWAEANALVETGRNMLPSLATEIRELEQIGYEKVRKLDKSAKAYIGNEVFRVIRETRTGFLLSVKNGTDQIAEVERILRMMTLLETYVQSMSDLRLLNPTEIKDFALKVQMVERRAREAKMRIGKK